MTQFTEEQQKEVARIIYNRVIKEHKYPRWNGHAVMKMPADLIIYQQVIHQNRPDFIIETGTKWGGSAVFLGDMCQLYGGQVISIDIAPKVQPEHPRVTYITGSSIDRDIVRNVEETVSGKVMVILDSKHTKNHVQWELYHYSKLVTPGQYIVVEDCYDSKMRPYGVKEARDWFLNRTRKFKAVDLTNQFFSGVTKDGWLIRK